MYLLRIGGNITALREFTALCNVDMIPLKTHLLGQHIDEAKLNSYNNNKDPRASRAAVDLSDPNHKDTLLKKMGGVEALGKGFTEYARKKFNPSQLMAISASSQGYGEGGFTLIKGPPGTGKTTTLVNILNALHIRQFNKYYDEVRRIVELPTGSRQAALEIARGEKPRILVCAPSNAAVDNVILKIMEDGFIDGRGNRYNPSMIRVGVGQSANVKDVALETKVDQILSENSDAGELQNSIIGYRTELQRITTDIVKCRKRIHAIANASPWPLSRDWEIRIDEESFDETGRVFFVNHIEKNTTFECPPPPEPGESKSISQKVNVYHYFSNSLM
jgi:senataxin